MGQQESNWQGLPDYCPIVVVCPDGEAEPAASYYTLQNLRPGTLYRVGIQEVTAESGETCSPWRRIQTKALGNGWRPPPLTGLHRVLFMG